MKVGDLVRHNLCGIGIIIKVVDHQAVFGDKLDCLVQYTSGKRWWVDPGLLEVVSESR